MKKRLLPKQINFLLSAYFIWFCYLLFAIFVGQHLFTLQNNFLMGGKINHLNNPLFWSWGNFDGEHYIAIAREGYKPLTHFYFPVYPLLIRLTAFFLGLNQNLNHYYFSSLLISHFSFISSIILFMKLLKLDKKSTLVKQTTIFFLLYPFSFFFIASYTESLFLFLCLLSFYFARKGNYWMASVLSGILSAIRVIGVAMLPALIIEWYLQDKNKRNLKQLFFLPFSLFGLFTYMYYLRATTGDALIFLNAVEIFGTQRSSTLILLPQVFYRYIFKIIPNLTLYFPVLFVTFWEIITALIGLALLIFGFFRLRASYWVYAFFAFLIPSLSGSFSSLPRYILVIFPFFMLSSEIISKLPDYLKYLLYTLLLLNMFVAVGLFSNGNFVS